MRAPHRNIPWAKTTSGIGAIEVEASPRALTRLSSGKRQSKASSRPLLAGRSGNNQPQQYTIPCPSIPWK